MGHGMSGALWHTQEEEDGRNGIVMRKIQRNPSTPLLVPHARRLGFLGASLVGVQRGARE